MYQKKQKQLRWVQVVLIPGAQLPTLTFFDIKRFFKSNRSSSNDVQTRIIGDWLPFRYDIFTFGIMFHGGTSAQIIQQLNGHVVEFTAGIICVLCWF